MRPAMIVGGSLAAVVLMSGIAITSAAFVQTISATGAVAGSVDIAQGPSADDQWSDPGTRHVIARAGAEDGVVTTLAADGMPSPTQETATVPITVQTVSPSSPVRVRFEFGRNTVAPTVWPALRFSLYVGDASLLPNGGVPLSADAVNAAAYTIDLPAGSAAGNSVVVTVKIWLAPDAPAEAYAIGSGVELDLDIDVVGESVGGQTIRTGVEFP